MQFHEYRTLGCEPGKTLEQSFRESAANTRNYVITDNFMADEHFPLVLDCLRLCATLCLLADDPSVIEPDVLAKDHARFQQTGDEKYIDRARRRGKVGWNVGHRMEVMPHYRRPHMALVWTGAGRAVPKVVPRRGSVVHRDIPTNELIDVLSKRRMVFFPDDNRLIEGYRVGSTSEGFVIYVTFVEPS